MPALLHFTAFPCYGLTRIMYRVEDFCASARGVARRRFDWLDRCEATRWCNTFGVDLPRLAARRGHAVPRLMGRTARTCFSCGRNGAKWQPARSSCSLMPPRALLANACRAAGAAVFDIPGSVTAAPGE